MRIRNGLLVAAFVTALNMGSASAGTVSPDMADMAVLQKSTEPIDQLMDGNRRFMDGRPQRPHQDADYRRLLAKGQHPHTAVACCIDSRVQPVLIFDAGLGDIMVFASPANIVDELAHEGLEYASGHLGVRLILILGHEKCGAMTAAVEANGKPVTQLRRIVASLSAAVHLGARKQGDRVHNCTEENVRKTVREIRAKKLPNNPKVVPAMYDIETGKVTILTE